MYSYNFSAKRAFLITSKEKLSLQRRHFQSPRPVPRGMIAAAIHLLPAGKCLERVGSLGKIVVVSVTHFVMSAQVRTRVQESIILKSSQDSLK
jgi:hypothetical protein